MSDLPADRLEDTPHFQSAGVDCFRPFLLTRVNPPRNSPPTVKILVVIFVCLPSRAIHLGPLDG